MKKCLYILSFLVTFNVSAQWSYVGSSDGFAPNGAIVPVLRFHPVNFEPYVFYFDFEQNVGAGYTLMRFDGSDWTDVGGRRFQPEEFGILTPFNVGFEFNLTNNRPVVYYDSPPNHVQEFDGISWLEIVGDNEISIDDFLMAGEGFGFAVNPLNGNPTVAFSDVSPEGTAGLGSVVSFGPEEWGYLSTPKFTQAVSSYFDIAYNSINGAPYLLHGGGTDNQITVSEFDGDIWNDLGDPNFANQNNIVAKIRIDQNNGDIYIAKPSTINSLPTIEVKKWDGDNWIDLVTDITQIHAQATAFDFQIHPSTGEVYLLYLDRDINNSLNVARFNGTNWMQLGTETVITGGSDYISLAFHPETYIPYVAYGSASETGGWVRKFDGVVGVNDNNVLETIILYPNPATNEVSFSNGAIISFLIYDTKGRLISEGEGRTANIDHLSEGVYFIKGIDISGNMITKRLVKK